MAWTTGTDSVSASRLANGPSTLTNGVRRPDTSQIACPSLGIFSPFERDPEKRQPVFRKDHAPTKKLSAGSFRRCLIGRLIGNARLGKGRHAGMACQSRAQDLQRHTRTGGFAEPHIEIDKRLQPDLIE